MDNIPSTNGWDEWRKYVLKALQQEEHIHELLQTEVTRLTVEVSKLKVTFAFYGVGIAALTSVMSWMAQSFLLGP